MNEKGFLALLDYLGYERVFSKRKADIILSPSCPLNTKRYPSKIYLFGPHFSTFPNKKTKKLSNYWGNAAYILPCEIMRKIWVDEFFFQNMPCFSFPFPLVLEDYPVLQSKKKTSSSLLQNA